MLSNIYGFSITFFDTLYVTGKANSTRGKICSQVYVSEKVFADVYPMHATRIFLASLSLFEKEVATAEFLVADPHPIKRKKDTKDFCNKIGTNLRSLEAKNQ